MPTEQDELRNLAEFMGFYDIREAYGVAFGRLTNYADFSVSFRDSFPEYYYHPHGNFYSLNKLPNSLDAQAPVVEKLLKAEDGYEALKSAFDDFHASELPDSPQFLVLIGLTAKDRFPILLEAIRKIKEPTDAN